MTSRRKVTPENVSTIFRYRGAGFSLDDIAEITDLSRQTISYHLKKMKTATIEDNISSVVRRFGNLVTMEEALFWESESQATINKIGQSLDEEFEKNIRLEEKLWESQELADEMEQGFEWPWNPVFNEFHPDVVNRGIIIDATNVLFQVISIESGNEPNTDVRISPHGLKFMFDQLEDEGWPVGAFMKSSTYRYAVDGYGLQDQERDILISLVDSGKLKLFPERDFDFLRHGHAPPGITIVSNDERLVDFYGLDAQISSFEWEGPFLKFSNLPLREPIHDEEQVESNDHYLARGLVDSMLSEGTEYIPVPNIHYKLASKFLGLEGQPSSWKKGWPERLKEELKLSGNSFTDQLYNLMDKEVEFDTSRNLVRKQP